MKIHRWFLSILVACIIVGQAASAITIFAGHDPTIYAEEAKNYVAVGRITLKLKKPQLFAYGTASLVELNGKQALITAAHVLKDAVCAEVDFPYAPSGDQHRTLTSWEVCGIDAWTGKVLSEGEAHESWRLYDIAIAFLDKPLDALQPLIPKASYVDDSTISYDTIVPETLVDACVIGFGVHGTYDRTFLGFEREKRFFHTTEENPVGIPLAAHLQVKLIRLYEFYWQKHVGHYADPAATIHSLEGSCSGGDSGGPLIDKKDRTLIGVVHSGVNMYATNSKEGYPLYGASRPWARALFQRMDQCVEKIASEKLVGKYRAMMQYVFNLPDFKANAAKFTPLTTSMVDFFEQAAQQEVLANHLYPSESPQLAVQKFTHDTKGFWRRALESLLSRFTFSRH